MAPASGKVQAFLPSWAGRFSPGSCAPFLDGIRLAHREKSDWGKSRVVEFPAELCHSIIGEGDVLRGNDGTGHECSLIGCGVCPGRWRSSGGRFPLRLHSRRWGKIGLAEPVRRLVTPTRTFKPRSPRSAGCAGEGERSDGGFGVLPSNWFPPSALANKLERGGREDWRCMGGVNFSWRAGTPR